MKGLEEIITHPWFKGINW